MEERTRERVPLDWAATTGSEGVALALIAERTADAPMAAHSVEQITTAYRVLLEAGHTQGVAYFKDQLQPSRPCETRYKAPTLRRRPWQKRLCPDALGRTD